MLVAEKPPRRLNALAHSVRGWLARFDFREEEEWNTYGFVRVDTNGGFARWMAKSVLTACILTSKQLSVRHISTAGVAGWASQLRARNASRATSRTKGVRSFRAAYIALMKASASAICPMASMVVARASTEGSLLIA